LPVATTVAAGLRAAARTGFPEGHAGKAMPTQRAVTAEQPAVGLVACDAQCTLPWRTQRLVPILAEGAIRCLRFRARTKRPASGPDHVISHRIGHRMQIAGQAAQRGVGVRGGARLLEDPGTVDEALIDAG